MPEGHVIHALARDLQQNFGAHPVRVSSPQGRFAAASELLSGHRLVDAQAWGKNLFLDFDRDAPDHLVRIHLGLIGKFRLRELAPPQGVVRLRLDNARVAADLSGPQLCALIGEDERRAVVDALGPDPLRPDADPERGWVRVHRSAKPVAALLMDQRIASGVGNIFRAEVLFRHRVRPTTPGKDLRRATWDAIWVDLVELMTAATVRGRIDTVYPEHMPEAMGREPRVDPHGGEVYVYRRAQQQCFVCGHQIRTAVMEGRHLYWCPTCQRRR